jgi:protein-S-isoprenylcysteine O-methyltransferase Ste14
MFSASHGLLVPFLVAAALHVTLRLLYFFWIGFSLRIERLRPGSPGDHHRRWLAFRTRARLILDADAVTFAIASGLAVGTLHSGLHYRWLLGSGLVLIVVGVWTKLQAFRVVGTKGYYWYNSFCPEDRVEYAPVGIYRWLKNPMYGPGYLHAPGIALVLASGPGLGLAFFDWAVVWTFYFTFERPHTRRLAAAMQGPVRCRAS